MNERALDKIDLLFGTINSIEEKINKVCETRGTFEYDIIEHIVAPNYTSLNIISKRLILEKLKDTIVITSSRFLDKSLAFSQYFNTDNILKHKDKDRTSLYKEGTYNEIISKEAIWVKLKDKNGDYIKFEDCYNGLNSYLKSKLFIYIIKGKLRLPYIDLNDPETVKETVNKILLEFNQDELRIIGYNGYFDAINESRNILEDS